jgi:hypothetical protein
MGRGGVGLPRHKSAPRINGSVQGNKTLYDVSSPMEPRLLYVELSAMVQGARRLAVKALPSSAASSRKGCGTIFAQA